MHVHVDHARIEVEKKRVHRIFTLRHHVLVGAHDRVIQKAADDKTPVDKQELFAARAFREIGPPHEAADGEHVVVLTHLDERAGHLLAEQIRDASAQLRRLRVPDGFAVRNEGDAQIGIREDVALHRVGDVAILGGIGLEELPPRRGVVEERLYRDRCADIPLGAGDFLHRSARHAHERGGVLARCAGLEFHLRHGRDGRQRLAAEPERDNALEIGRAADLARGVPLEGQ